MNNIKLFAVPVLPIWSEQVGMVLLLREPVRGLTEIRRGARDDLPFRFSKGVF